MIPGIVTAHVEDSIEPPSTFGDNLLGLWMGTVYMGIDATSQAFNVNSATFPNSAAGMVNSDASLAVSAHTTNTFQLLSRSGTIWSQNDSYSAASEITSLAISGDGSLVGYTSEESFTGGQLVIFPVVSGLLDTPVILNITANALCFSNDAQYFAFVEPILGSGREFHLRIREVSNPTVNLGSVLLLDEASIDNWGVLDFPIAVWSPDDNFIGVTSANYALVDVSTPASPSLVGTATRGADGGNVAFNSDESLVVFSNLFGQLVIRNTADFSTVSYTNPSTTLGQTRLHGGWFTPDDNYYVLPGTNYDNDAGFNILVYQVSDWSIWYEGFDNNYDTYVCSLDPTYGSDIQHIRLVG